MVDTGHVRSRQYLAMDKTNIPDKALGLGVNLDKGDLV